MISGVDENGDPSIIGRVLVGSLVNTEVYCSFSASALSFGSLMITSLIFRTGTDTGFLVINI